MVDIDKLCPGCMQHLKDSNTTCPHCGYPEKRLTVKDSLPVFSILAGKYLLGAPLGKGGFGITYIAMHLPDEKIVAIKEFFPANLAVRDTDNETVVPADDTKAVYYRTGMKSFSEEGRILYLLSDIEHVVHVAEQIQANNTTYLVMEYVPGISLKKYMKQQQKLFSEQEMLTLMQPILLALQTMHQKGILHRDISPENLMLSPDNTLTLIDFGAARTFSRSDDDNLTVILKRGYAPEEQYHSNSRQGPWTDLYAVCAVMYQMLTGILPQEASARAEEDHLTPVSRIEGLSLSPSTCAALEKGLQMDPMERYPDIGALMKVLYPAKKEETQEITDNSPKETQEMDASEKNAELPKPDVKPEENATSSTSTPVADKTCTHHAQQSSSNTKENPDVGKKKHKKIIIAAAAIILVFCFFYLRSPGFYLLHPSLDPYANSLIKQMNDAFESQDHDLLLSAMDEVDNVWGWTPHSDEYNYPHGISTNNIISAMPTWCKKLNEHLDDFDFSFTNTFCLDYMTLKDEEYKDRITEETRTIGVFITMNAGLANDGILDRNNTQDIISDIYNTIYRSASSYGYSLGLSPELTGMGAVYLTYIMAFEHPDSVDSWLWKEENLTVLHDALKNFFYFYPESVTALLDYFNYPNDFNQFKAHDDFMQQMKLFIDENNISS